MVFLKQVVHKKILVLPAVLPIISLYDCIKGSVVGGWLSCSDNKS